jgi:signal transduction histidine kinase
MPRFSTLSWLFACGACAALGAAAGGRQARRAARAAPHAPGAEAPSTKVTGGQPTRRPARDGDERAGDRRVTTPDPARNRDQAGRDRVDALSRRKQDFLGLLSHELRNPLSAIQVALAVMRARQNIDAGQQARTVIERQVAHIARLVDDLVDSARIERGTLSLRLEPLDLRDVLDTAVEMVQPSVALRRQDLIRTSLPDAMQVSGDRVRLQQVFSNLLLNASKYTPEGGTIQLVASRDASDFCVSVRDNGVGIAEQDLATVFEPFVRATREASGLGVGLYVARTLVEQHGGEIGVISVGTGQGSTFTVRLPELSPLFRDTAEARTSVRQ